MKLFFSISIGISIFLFILSGIMVGFIFNLEPNGYAGDAQAKAIVSKFPAITAALAILVGFIASLLALRSNIGIAPKISFCIYSIPIVCIIILYIAFMVYGPPIV